MRRTGQRCAAAAVMLAALGATSSVLAQEQQADTATVALGVDGMLLLPVGDFGKVTGVGVGPMAKVEYRFDPTWTFAARGGFLYHASKKMSSRTTEVPVLLGAKMFFDPSGQGWYGAAEVGLVYLTYHTKAAGAVFGGAVAPGADEEITASKWKAAGTASVGYRMAPLDFRAGLFLGTLDHPGDAAALMASVGYEVPIL